MVVALRALAERPCGKSALVSTCGKLERRRHLASARAGRSTTPQIAASTTTERSGRRAAAVHVAGIRSGVGIATGPGSGSGSAPSSGLACGYAVGEEVRVRVGLAEVAKASTPMRFRSPSRRAAREERREPRQDRRRDARRRASPIDRIAAGIDRNARKRVFQRFCRSGAGQHEVERVAARALPVKPGNGLRGDARRTPRRGSTKRT